MTRIDTICRNCVFAIYNKETQVGCECKRIYKYGRKGHKIVAASDDPNDPPPDGYKEYFVIEGTPCNMSRTKIWKETRPDGTDLMKEAKRETRIRYNWILVNRKENDILLKDRLNAIKEQTLQPERISLIRYNTSPIHPSLAGSLLNKRFKFWVIEDMVSENDHPDIGLDAIFTKYRSPFYFISDVSDNIPPPDFAEKINEIINEELVQFAIMDTDNVRVVPTAVHIKLQGGMFGTNLKEKVDAICPEKVISRKLY
jgi:hypothetical protein